jgi:hypothetical protein
MILEIETEAAKSLLGVLLSCQCPIKKEAEKEIVQYYLSHKHDSTFDFQKMIEIAGPADGNTVFHRLRDFCLYSKNNLDKITITEEDVYRHFCSAFHWKIVEDALVSSYKDISDIRAWFVGHMLLPVRLKGKRDSVLAEYSTSDAKIRLLSVFIPPDIKVKDNGLYSIHFASVISEITAEHYRMINQQLEAIRRFIEFRNDVKEIDYSDFQKLKNYREFCENRYLKYFQIKL